jgi:hypothetical protein
MSQKVHMAVACLFLSTSVFAGTYRCETDTEIKTPKGTLSRDYCKSSDRFEESKSIWRLGDQKLVAGKYPITDQSRNPSKTIFVLQSTNNNKNGCADQVFLIDLAGERPRVFALGVTYSCAIFHWAKWSDKKRSVIALKDNVQFTYSNGKIIPPDDTDTKFGSPLGYSVDLPKGAQVAAFVHELPLPKN